MIDSIEYILIIIGHNNNNINSNNNNNKINKVKLTCSASVWQQVF